MTSPHTSDVLAGFGAMSDVDRFREVVEETRDDLDDTLRESG